MNRPANLPSAMRLFAGILASIYTLSIAGYVVLDGTHELLHVLRSSLHHHKHIHGYSHHHVEDHHHINLDSDSTKDVKVVIYYFHLFFQEAERKNTFLYQYRVEWKSFKTIFTNLCFPPATPPPLALLHVRASSW